MNEPVIRTPGSCVTPLPPLRAVQRGVLLHLRKTRLPDRIAVDPALDAGVVVAAGELERGGQAEQHQAAAEVSDSLFHIATALFV